MAKPISPSYPVTGNQAENLIKDIENTNRGEVDPAQRRLIENNMDKALRFFRNVASILPPNK